MNSTVSHIAPLFQHREKTWSNSSRVPNSSSSARQEASTLNTTRSHLSAVGHRSLVNFPQGFHMMFFSFHQYARELGRILG